MNTIDGTPARAACAATELARLPVDAQAKRVNPSARAAVSATETTRSLNEWVGLAESSLTHSGARSPSSAASASARDQRGQAGVEGDPGGRVLARRAAAAAYRQMLLRAGFDLLAGDPAQRGRRRSRPRAGRNTRNRRAGRRAGYSVPQPRQTRQRAGLVARWRWGRRGSTSWRGLPLIFPRRRTLRRGRNWHLPRAASTLSHARWLPGRHRAVPSAPLDERAANQQVSRAARIFSCRRPAYGRLARAATTVYPTP